MMLSNLKLQLWNLGLRQNKLAQMLDLDETVISKIINGFREPTGEVRRRIAELLEADEQWLFDKPSTARHNSAMRLVNSEDEDIVSGTPRRTRQ